MEENLRLLQRKIEADLTNTMTKEREMMSMKIFLETATEEQKQQLEQCESKEAVLALADTFCVTLTAEETQILETAFRDQTFGELDEADLDQIAGGGQSFQVPAGKTMVISNWLGGFRPPV